jgi:hypothetical protein
MKNVLRIVVDVRKEDATDTPTCSTGSGVSRSSR